MNDSQLKTLLSKGLRHPSLIDLPTGIFANGTETAYVYDALNRLTQVDHAISTVELH